MGGAGPADDRAKAGALVVVGAGGHAKVVIELLRASGFERIVGLLDADPTPRTVLGCPVIGTDERLPSLLAEGVAQAFIAVGDNRLRVRLGRQARTAGFGLVNAISPRAVISPSATIGDGVAIMAGAVVNAQARIDDWAIVNTGSCIDHDGIVGEGAHVGPGCALAGNVTIGPMAFLGVGVSVIPRIVVGEGATVGAGACLVRDIPAGTKARGVPARVTP